MEKNTFVTSAYICAETNVAFQYLCNLENLSQWTLGNKIKEQIDENTWCGTASSTRQPFYYHIKKLTELPFPCYEWHCGTEYRQYKHIYPVFLFPLDYVSPGLDDKGFFFHWVSFISPKKRTKLIDEGIIDILHTSETRALKAVLERNQGLRAPARCRLNVIKSSVYIDSSIDQIIKLLGDVVNLPQWNHLVRPRQINSNQAGIFLDGYNLPFEMTATIYTYSECALIEYSTEYLDTTSTDQTVTLRKFALITPCSYAFGNPTARGCIVHRLEFMSENDGSNGRAYSDLAAENLSIKRLLEIQAGNEASLDHGLSYTEPNANN